MRNDKNWAEQGPMKNPKHKPTDSEKSYAPKQDVKQDVQKFLKWARRKRKLLFQYD